MGPNGEMMAGARSRTTGTTLQTDTPVTLFPTRIFGGGGGQWTGPAIRCAPGRSLPDRHGGVSTGSAPITLIQNWKPPAK